MDPYNGKPETSGWVKGAIGCAIGCGVLVLLVMVAGGISTWWMVSTGEQRPTASIVAPDGVGAFHVADLGADPGVTALLDHFVRETQRQQQEGMPGWLRQLHQMGAAGGSPSAGFRMLLPRQATITLEPPDGDQVAQPVLVAFNPRGLTRFFRFIMPEQETAGKHRGQPLHRLGTDAYLTLLDGTVLFANEERTLRRGIDRLLDGGGGAAPPPPDLGPPVRSWDLTGVVEEREGRLASLLRQDRGTIAGLERALVGIDVASRDLVTGRLVVECSHPEAAVAAGEALEARASEHAAKLVERGLELRIARRDAAGRVVLDWEVHGLAAATGRWAVEASRQADGYGYGYGSDASGPD